MDHEVRSAHRGHESFPVADVAQKVAHRSRPGWPALLHFVLFLLIAGHHHDFSYCGAVGKDSLHQGHSDGAGTARNQEPLVFELRDIHSWAFFPMR